MVAATEHDLKKGTQRAAHCGASLVRLPAGTHGLGRPPMQSAQPEVAAAAGSAAAAVDGDAEPEGAGVALQAQPLGQSKEAKAAQRAETVQRFLQQLQAELPEPEHKQVSRADGSSCSVWWLQAALLEHDQVSWHHTREGVRVPAWCVGTCRDCTAITR